MCCAGNVEYIHCVEVVNEYGYEQLFSIIFITLINFSLEMKCVCVCVK